MNDASCGRRMPLAACLLGLMLSPLIVAVMAWVIILCIVGMRYLVIHFPTIDCSS
ncbi:hypothetical protein [Paraburkholderia youngii]|uniref:hypothetical protein n=1 Tax=Paraburkholderia youngii TaxID=2782701 RepID=UPI003D22BBE0